MIEPSERERLLGPVTDLARRAGEAILAIYHEAADYEVTDKADNSPLTVADVRAHRVIDDGLRELRPDIPILSEESSAVPYSERARWTAYWLVDPLDGTREFIKRNGEFTVNIALVDGGAPVLGIVHAPVIATDYFAARGAGAYKRVGEAEPTAIEAQRLGNGPIRVAGSRSHADERLQAFLDRLADYELRPMGSSLKFCLVAEGAADVYARFGRTSEWDTAAAQAVVEAAGGHVTDTALQPLRYNRGESLLNPDFLAFGDARHDWSSYL
jgi:3'(2'), 5'-bisphosphate nucleotidase